MRGLVGKKLGMTQLFDEETGAVQLPEGQEMVMPGDNTNMDIELIQPIAMDQGLRFAIREGGRTVGAGVVANITK